MTRDINSTDDIIDIRDVIENFEELETSRKPWRAGWNMPGYMPDSEPSSFETWEDARDYLVEELARFSDEAFDLADDIDTAKARCANYDAAIERLNAATDGEEQGETVGNYHYWIAEVSGVEAFECEIEGQEYEDFRALLEELAGNGGDEDWRGDWYPITLIRDSHFVDAMRELCEDIGDIPRDIPSYIEIDWEATARNLRVDYSSVEFRGVTFWYR